MSRPISYAVGLVAAWILVTSALPLGASEGEGAATAASPISTPPAEQPPADETPEQAHRRELTKIHGAEVADAILAGTVRKEMTMAQVLLARGEPDRKEVIPPDAELWHYPGGEVAFSAGKVSYVSLTAKSQPASVGTGVGAMPGNQGGDSARSGPASQVDIPPMRVGDTYVYESLDPAKPNASLTTRRTVTSTSGEIVLSSLNLDSKRAKARSLHFDREWNLIASRSPNGSGRDYAPPLAYYDFPLFQGKRWQRTTTETNIKTGAIRIHRLSGLVKGWETVSVPAGTFRGLRVELETELYDPSTGERTPGTDTSWYVPEVRRSVRSDTTGKGGTQRVIQLMSYDVK